MDVANDPNEAKRRYPDVASLFRGKDILITGVSGFLGKVLLEKLLRTYHDIGTIFVLLRAKKGVEPAKRIEELLNDQLFETVISQLGGITAAQKRICVMRGDVSQPGLGMSEEDSATVARRVAIFLHCAANVRFDTSLRQALQNNTLGTKHSLQVAEKIKNLEAFVQVSTSYCHCDLPVVEERLYPPQADPDKVLDLLDWMNDDMLSIITPKLLGPLPNTYALSKNLAEGLIGKYEGKFPIGLARPSIVTAVWKEPLPGWVDNLNGPTGLLLGAGMGVIRSMLCQGDYHADVMPVDMVANAVISLAWRVANERSAKVDVVNITSYEDSPLTWVNIMDRGRELVYKYPLSNAVWFPGGNITTSWLVHMLCVIFFHLLPAYLIDFLAMLCGRKPFMVRIQSRIQGGLKALQYYTTHEWNFPNTRMKALHRDLPPEDQETLYWDMTVVDMNDYMRISVLGTRHIFLKDSPESLPKARRKLWIFYLIHRAITIAFFGCFLWFIFLWFRPILTTLEMALGSVVQVTSYFLHLNTETSNTTIS